MADSIAEALLKNKLINEHQMRAALNTIAKKLQVRDIPEKSEAQSNLVDVK